MNSVPKQTLSQRTSSLLISCYTALMTYMATRTKIITNKQT